MGYFTNLKRKWKFKLALWYNRFKSRFSKGITNDQFEWAMKHHAEEIYGVAILHRQRRLQELLAEAMQQQHQKQKLLQITDGATAKEDADDGGELPHYDNSNSDETVKKLNNEPKILQREYFGHQTRLAKIASNRLRGYATKEWMILHKYKDQHNRFYLWNQTATLCADIGGCCSRECGCCERPLREYLRPTGDDGKKEVVGIYGHCLSECPCYIKHRGFYMPYGKLPKTDFR